MRAFVVRPAPIRGAGRGAPTAAPGQVVVDVERDGVCGTDVELFTGKMAYFQEGHAAYPMRLGHEWWGRVAAVGAGFMRPSVRTRPAPG